MKIALTGDFHFGFSEDAAPQAARALEACRDADAVIAAGDLFDSRIPRQETLNEAFLVFANAKKALKSGVEIGEISADSGGMATTTPITGYPPIFVIHGTHERRSRGLVNPIDLLDSARAAVKIHGRIIELKKNGERVCLQGMGGVPEEYARQAMRRMDFRPVEGAFNVFVFHQSLEEALPFGETLSCEDLPEGFGLCVDGHIHWAQEIKSAGRRVIIPGSTVVTQMKRKEALDKSVAVFDTESGAFEKRGFKTRPFIYREIDFPAPSSPAEIISKASEALSEIQRENYWQKPQVKLKLSGKLARGYLPADVNTAGLAKSYGAGMLLFVDRDFESFDFDKSVERVRQFRGANSTVKELSLSLLSGILKERGVEIAYSELEELLEALSESDLEKASGLL